MKPSKKYKYVGGKDYYDKTPLKPNDRYIDWDVKDILQEYAEDINNTTKHVLKTKEFYIYNKYMEEMRW